MTREQRLPHPDTVSDRITELRLLWPALPAALPRDSGTQAGERVHGSSDPHVIPINPHVAATIRRLAHHIPYLTFYEQQYGDAYVNWRPADAWPITNRISGMLTDARNALGLNRPDQPIGPHCPRHDDPLTPLVTPGDQGELRYDAIGPAGELVGGWIRWTHTDLVTCHHCGEEWPPSKYLWLSRMVADAEARRAEQAEAGHDAA